jgi:DNA-binding beta-propeller fold protein YncE
VRSAVIAVSLLALAGCAAEQPPAAGPPGSPALTVRPAGRVDPGTPAVTAGRFSLDRRASRLRLADGRSVATGREPVALAGVGHGRAVAVLTARDRTLEVYDAVTLRQMGSVAAGIGPARLAADGANLLYVTDPVGRAVLVFHLRPQFELIRRVPLHAAPYAIAFDPARGSLWITLPAANRLLEYAAGARPVPRRAFPSIRSPLEVAVDADAVTVYGHGRRQVLDLSR